jgi:RNA polymerase sigma-70 factor (ECF subfamily)
MGATFDTTVWPKIEEAQRGRSTAVDELVARYMSPLVQYVAQWGISQDDAEDVVQEVFLRMLGEGVLGRAREGRGRFRHFLVGVARNVLRETRRKSGRLRQARAPEDLDIPAPEPSPEEFDRLWADHLLRRALRALFLESPRQHRILGLYFERGVPLREIAHDLGMSTQQVKNDIHRSKRKLVRFIKAEIREYASSRGEYEEELALLQSLLPLRE